MEVAVGTALLHSLAVSEKRGSFKNWTVLLAIAAFSLSLLGTFLVRSGVLTSVHAFAADPRRGVFILVFLAVVVGVCLFTGYAHPWLVIAFVLIWRGIQDYAVSPLVMGHGIDIHPALVIVGVLAGGEVAGVAGMFLSVPLIAAIRIVWRRLQARPETPASDTAVGPPTRVA